jgi:hypothetical protein
MPADPMLLQSIAILGATALGLGIAVVAGLGLWRAISDERPLLLSELLALEGVDMGVRVRGTGARQFALAARTCVQCTARGRCEEWLSARRADGYEAFCPNAGYIARMKDCRG